MRILLTNISLAGGTGTETLLRDLAPALRDRGHSVIAFAPRWGRLAGEIRAQGIAAIQSVGELGEPPDIIHGQHAGPTMAALAAFPGVPAIYMLHDWGSAEDDPPIHPRIHRYLYVRDTLRERLVSENAIAPERVAFWPNGVDLRRLGPPAPPAPALRRVGIFSHPGRIRFAGAIEAACAARGMAFAGELPPEFAGNPPAWLQNIDLVFATGRMAIEAIAAGKAVVLADHHGIGGLVTPENLDRCIACNFAPGARSAAADATAIGSALDAYVAADTAAVTAKIRQQHDIRAGAAKLEAIYRDAIAAPAAVEPDGVATARFIEGWLKARVYHERQGPPGRRDQEAAEHLITEIEALRQTTAELSRHVRRLSRPYAAISTLARSLRSLGRR